MSIRKKLIISNLLMILVPVVVFLLLGYVWLCTAGRSYWSPIEEMYEDKNGVISAQNLIYAYQDELWDTNWTNLEDNSARGESISQSPQMIRLNDELTDLGYHFAVTMEGETLYSNLTQEDQEQARNLIGDMSGQAQSVTAGTEETSVIKCTFYEDGEACSILAVNNGKNDILNSRSYLQRHVIPYVWLFVILLVIAVLVINGCCTGWITRLILPPMKEIQKGMQKIRAGDLDGDIPVLRQDELGELCGEFNEMKQYLRKSEEERRKYEMYRRELISGVSHDLRTPLTTIKGYVRGILDGIADTKEKQERYLLAVQTRTEDMENLVEQLSSYNIMENHIFRYKMEKTDLAEFIACYLSENQEYLEENKVKVSVSTEKSGDGNQTGETLWAVIDTREFRRVFDNIIINTIRYRTKESSRMNVELKRQDSRLLLNIADDGPGVPDEDLEKIFESFCRLDASRTRCSEGSGLGLAIVKRIVLDHNGILHAENRGGLAVCIELPAVERND